MATVYLAQDLRHDRRVALKVLRPELAAVLGADRFVVEIKTTAALQHPHILPLFDSGTADSFLYYVMPFIQGETLRARLDRETQLGIEEAVRITRDVADALDYAHRHGVIHRDIKPENILLHDGRPVVADFGIALAVSAAAGGRMTETGLSLGTPHYMSPEQATAEKELTHRADIYSLGCVLYEMLIGNPPHVGATAQQIVMKIVLDPVRPVSEIRKSVPPNVAAAVAKAVEKLPADRFETAAKFAEALANPAFGAGTTATRTGASAHPVKPVSPALVAVSAFALLASIAAAWGWLRPQEPQPVRRYELGLDSAAALWPTGRWGRIAISPDGSLLVYVGPRGALMLRRRDQLEARPIPGAERAGAPTFSPDGKRIAFIQNATTLTVASLDGSPPVAITDSLVGLGGSTWAGNDSLITDGRGATPMVRVAARAGARPETMAPFDSTMGEVDQVWPEVLPGGAVLYTMQRGSGHSIAVLDPRTGTRRVLVENGRRPRFASGHLLYVTSDGVLMAAKFNPRTETLEGEPQVLGEDLAIQPSALDFVVSQTGTLAFISAANADQGSELTWVSRGGTVEVLDSTWRASLADPAVSPDGARLAISDATFLSALPEGDVWVRPIRTGGRLRVSAGGRNRFPVWTRDGKRLLSVQQNGGTYSIMEGPGDAGSTATRRYTTTSVIGIVTATPDGEWVVYTQGLGRGGRLYAHRRGDSVSTPVMSDGSPGSSPALSPDGRFLAFTVPTGDLASVQVTPFPNPGNVKWLVSPDPGIEPVWSNSGKELFYRNPVAGTVVAVTVNTLGGFTLGAPKTLFPSLGSSRFAVSHDDTRFLMIRPLGSGAQRSRLMVVESWVTW